MTIGELQWQEEIERLLTEDGSRALEARDQLVATEGSRLTRALGEVVASPSREASVRIHAVWLLKDLCDPLSTPYLERALAGPSDAPGLREAIIDALERLAFARLLPDLNLRKLATSLGTPSERDHFIDLLLAVGTEEARGLLKEFAQNADALAKILSSAVALPGDWVDLFLADLVGEPRSADQVKAVIEERAHRRYCAGLKQLGPSERVGGSVVERLESRHELALICWLAQHDHLDLEGSRFVLAMDGEKLSEGNRRLLRDAKRLLDQSPTAASQKVLAPPSRRRST